MMDLTSVLHDALQRTRFEAPPYGPFNTHDASRLYAARTDLAHYLVRHMTPVVPEAALAAVVSRLEQDLKDYIEPASRRIGTGLIQLMGGALHDAEPTVTDFARTLLVAASRIGAPRAAAVLQSWIDGEPYRYRMVMLLTGVRSDEPLSLEEGVSVARLPESSGELNLPCPLDHHSLDTSRFLGGTVLSIHGTAAPTLYRPTRAHGEDPEWNLRQVWAGGHIPSLLTDRWRTDLTAALSLACDHPVGWTHIWRDVGDAAAFNDPVYPEWRDAWPRWTTVSLEQQHLEAARDIAGHRHANSHRRAAIDVAIARWMSSKRAEASLANAFIDLRIALEALYIPRGSFSELRFRLAVFGAFHLGADSQDRRLHYDTLSEAYRLGSVATHTGRVEDNPENRRTLTGAQAACRAGILKRLTEMPHEWNDIDLILG